MKTLKEYKLEDLDRRYILQLLTALDLKEIRGTCELIELMPTEDRLACIREISGVPYSNPYGFYILQKECETFLDQPFHIYREGVDVTITYEKGTLMFEKVSDKQNTIRGTFTVHHKGTPLKREYQLTVRQDPSMFSSVNLILSSIENHIFKILNDNTSWRGFSLGQIHDWVMGDPQTTQNSLSVSTQNMGSYYSRHAMALCQCMNEILSHYFDLGSIIDRAVFTNVLLFQAFGDTSTRLFNVQLLDKYGVYAMNNSRRVFIPDEDGNYRLFSTTSPEFKRIQFADKSLGI